MQIEVIDRKFVRLDLEGLFDGFDERTLPDDIPKHPLAHVKQVFMGQRLSQGEFAYAIGPLVSNFPLYFGHDELYRRFGLMSPGYQYAFVLAVSHMLDSYQVNHLLLSVRWEGHTHRRIEIEKLRMRGDLAFDLRR